MGSSYEFKIQLDKKDGTFQPGEHVTGHVALTVTKSTSVKEIVVTLVGECKSANYKYVREYNNFTRRYEQRRISSSIEYSLFNYRAKVFPPPNLQVVGLAGEYTLVEGNYTYPFDLAFPSGPVQAQTSSRFGAGSLYLGSAFMFSPNLPFKGSFNTGPVTVALPPSFRMMKDNDDYAIVSYRLDATVERKGFFKSDLVVIRELKFSPRLELSMFSFGPLLQQGDSPNSGFIEDTNTGVSRLKFDIEKSKRHEGRGFLRRVFASRSVKVPFEALVEFQKSNAVAYPQGQTARVLHKGDNFADIASVRLITAFSADALQRMLIGGDSKKDAPPVSLSDIKINAILLGFQHSVYYQGIEARQATRGEAIDTKNFNNEFLLSDFEEIEYYSSELVQKVKQDYAGFIQTGKAYVLEIPPEMLNFVVRSNFQSFSAPNILVDFSLTVRIKISTSGENPRSTNVLCQAPIILLPPRNNGAPDDYALPPDSPPPVENLHLSSPKPEPATAVKGQVSSDEPLPAYSEVK